MPANHRFRWYVVYLPLILAALQDKDRDVTQEACVTLTKVGDNGPKVRDALTELTKNKDDEGLREAAKWALEQIPKAPALKK